MMMNDRIYELAEQAAEFTDANEFAAIERRIWDSIFRNKFAELIIQECIDICMKKYDTGLLMAPQSPWIANQIKEHFGVEL
jgi:hypothetical protein